MLDFPYRDGFFSSHRTNREKTNHIRVTSELRDMANRLSKTQQQVVAAYFYLTVCVYALNVWFENGYVWNVIIFQVHNISEQVFFLFISHMLFAIILLGTSLRVDDGQPHGHMIYECMMINTVIIFLSFVFFIAIFWSSLAHFTYNVRDYSTYSVHFLLHFHHVKPL